MTSKGEGLIAKGERKDVPKPTFDIAKFAGIFAAIGMALGMIGTALASVAKGLQGYEWWQYIVILACILLVISGPSMVIAWLKLRRRNLAPVLNANGWAINADAIISVPFGRTLTEQVRFPLVKDPLAKAKKGMKPWQATLITLSAIALFIVAMCFGYKYITRAVVEEKPTTEIIQTPDTVTAENQEICE